MERQRLSMSVAGGLLTPLLTWLALPGSFSWWPLLSICLVPLLFSVAAASSSRQSFSRGLVAGVILHLLQIYWIVPVLMHYGHLPWYLAVPALVLLACYMGLYLGAFSVGFWLLLKRGVTLATLFGGAALWVGLDWLRSWLFSGFPWMDLGYGFWATPRLIQAADLFGHHGYTFVVLLINGAVFHLLVQRHAPRRAAVGVLAVASVCLLLGGYAQVRWQQVQGLLDDAETAVIGIVQGNVEQDRKWSPAERERTVRNYLDLSAALSVETGPDLIVWPETALPFYPRNSELMIAIGAFVRQNRQPLLTGAPWYEVHEDNGSRMIFYYNAALLLEPENSASARYFKSHLVPFGEYVP
ncbi:MAG: apolipoprotein N-acyltransferase, partial [Desulfofustis sp.]|nr:apolipoprotein N-acyltransferase [Desulfofustis sp.]